LYWLQINLKYEDDTPVDRKGSGRKVIKKLQQTNAAELANKDFAYDGEKSMFTIGALSQVKNEFTVVVDDVSTVVPFCMQGLPISKEIILPQ